MRKLRERAVTPLLGAMLVAACSPSNGVSADAGDGGDGGNARDASGDAPVSGDAGSDAKPSACAATDASAAFPSRQFGGSSNFASEIPWGLAVDGAGGVVIAGVFDGAIDFGGGALTSSGLGSIFLAKLDASGAHVFSSAWGGPDQLSDAIAKSVAVDSAGNIAVAGFTTGFVDLGDGSLPNGSFVAKFSPSGKLLWSRGFAGYGIQQANGVAFDSSGDVVLAGVFYGSVDFGGGPLPNPSGSTAVGVAKLDPAGTHLASRLFAPSSGSAAGLAVAVDAAGDVAIAGSFSGGVDFGTGPLASAQGSVDAFVVVLDPLLQQPKIAKRFGGAGTDEAASVAFDPSGGVIASGRFEDSADFGGGTLTSAGGSDAYVVALDSSGAHRWSKRFGDTQEDDASSVAVDGLGRVALTGSFNGTVDFGGGGLTSAGGADVFLAVLDGGGGYVRAARFGDSNVNQFGYHVAVDAACRTMVTGAFGGTIDFGQGPLTAGAGLEAIFLASP